MLQKACLQQRNRYLLSVIFALLSVLFWLYSIKFLTDPLPYGTPPNLEGEFLVSKLSSVIFNPTLWA